MSKRILFRGNKYLYRNAQHIPMYCEECPPCDEPSGSIYFCGGGDSLGEISYSDYLDTDPALVLLSTGGGRVRDMTSQNGYIYFTHEIVFSPSFEPFRVRRINLDGTGLTTLVSGGGAFNGICSDASKLYFTNNSFNPGRVYSCNHDGSSVTMLVELENDGWNRQPLRLSQQGGTIFFIEDRTGADHYRALRSVSTSGGTISTLVEKLIGTWQLEGLHANATHVYSCDILSHGVVWRHNHSGGDETALYTGTSSSNHVRGDVEQWQDRVYFISDNFISLAHIDLDGSNYTVGPGVNNVFGLLSI